MGLGDNPIQRRNDKGVQGFWTRQRVLMLVSIMFGIVVLAWFDGGEEALHQISEDIPVPESR